MAHEVWRHGESDARKLKMLEEENRKLKRLLAESMWRHCARLSEKTSDAQFAEDGGDLGN